MGFRIDNDNGYIINTTESGVFELTAGYGGTTGSGGSVTIFAGNGGTTSGPAGGIYLEAGQASDGSGGSIYLTATSAAGAGNNDGGDVYIYTGSATGTGQPGKVITEITGGGYHQTSTNAIVRRPMVREYIIATETTDGTSNVEMFRDGAGGTLRMVLPNNCSWQFDVHVSAHRTDAIDESAGFHYAGVIDRQSNAASTDLVGTVQTIMSPQQDNSWTVLIDAETSDGSLRVRVTGEALKSIDWVAYVRVVEAGNGQQNI